MAKTGNDILVGIKRRITMPQSQPLLLDKDILEVTDDVIQSRLVPVLISTRQDFFVITKDIPIIPNIDEYHIPPRAVGRTLRDLKRKVDRTGKVDVTLVGIEDEHFAPWTGIPFQFYFKGDKICLSPKPAGDDGVLELWFELMPSKLTTLDKAGTIINIGPSEVTVAQLPTDFRIGMLFDIVTGVAGHSCKKIDGVVTNIVGNTVYVDSLPLYPNNVIPGDYITIAGQSPVMQLPDEAYPYLETETCYRLLQSISDYEGARFLQNDIDVELKNLKLLLEPRIQGEATKIIPRMGLARGSRSRWKWGFLR